MPNPIETRRCVRCYGTGQTRAFPFFPASPITCPDCGGTGREPNPPVVWTDTTPTRAEIDRLVTALFTMNCFFHKEFKFTINDKPITLSAPTDLTPEEVQSVAGAVRFLLEERLKP